MNKWLFETRVMAAESKSAAQDFGDASPVEIQVPELEAGTTQLSFETSFDGKTFGPLMYHQGQATKKVIVPCSGGDIIHLDTSIFWTLRYLKIITEDNTGAPVAQSVLRNFVVSAQDL